MCYEMAVSFFLYCLLFSPGTALIPRTFPLFCQVVIQIEVARTDKIEE